MNLIGLEMCYPWAGMSDCIRQPSAISLNHTMGGSGQGMWEEEKKSNTPYRAEEANVSQKAKNDFHTL